MSNLNVQNLNGVNVQNLPSQTARAWVNFNGTGTVAIRKAFNVASITDNGTGDYSVNFLTTLPTPDLVVTPAASFPSGAAAVAVMLLDSTVASARFSLRSFGTGGYSVTPADSAIVTCTVFN